MGRLKPTLDSAKMDKSYGLLVSRGGTTWDILSLVLYRIALLDHHKEYKNTNKNHSR